MSKKRKGEAVQADTTLEQAKRSSPLFKRLLLGQRGGLGHDHGSSLREDHHKGHHIVIKTTYEVTIDGKKFAPPLGVSNAGIVEYHGMPNIGFPSAVDLIKCIIDQFPADFARRTREPQPVAHDHHDHRGAGAGRRPRAKRK